MLFRKVLRVLHELLPVLEVLLGQVTPERVLWFGLVDEGDQRLDDLKRNNNWSSKDDSATLIVAFQDFVLKQLLAHYQSFQQHSSNEMASKKSENSMEKVSFLA